MGGQSRAAVCSVRSQADCGKGNHGAPSEVSRSSDDAGYRPTFDRRSGPPTRADGSCREGASSARPADVAGGSFASFRQGRKGGSTIISCDEFFTEFGDYIENRVPPEVRKELELHLSQCRACHVLYDSACKTVKIVTDSGSFELPQAVSDSIIDSVMAKLRAERT